MTIDIQKYFVPGSGVELVYNLDSLHPWATSTIIYETNHRSLQIIVAQPIIHLRHPTGEEPLHLTTLGIFENKKQRIGVRCVPLNFSNSYQLANGTTTEVVTLADMPPAMITNIRSGYRLPLSRTATVKAKLFYDNTDFFSPIDFFIRDISLNGMGLIIPNVVNSIFNRLKEIETREQLMVELTLTRPGSGGKPDKIKTPVEVVRIDGMFSQTSQLTGVKFIALTNTQEELLNGFIHQAQMDELKRLSGLF